jgi:adenylate cyclase
MAAKHAKIEILQGIRTEPMYTGELNRPLEVGRQRVDDVGQIYTRRQSLVDSDRDRIAIADTGYNGMSRQLALISPLEDGRIRVDNLSTSNTIEVEDQVPLEPKQTRELAIPVTLRAFDRRISITPAAPAHRDSAAVRSLNRPIQPPGDETALPFATIDGAFPFSDSVSIEDNDQLLQWLSAVMRVLQSAIGSVDFDKSAAKEMVDLVGLDSGRVLRWESNGSWTVEASYHREPERSNDANWIPISRLMQQVTDDKSTSWTCPAERSGATESTKDVLLAVAAPLLDPTGRVIGALYGERRTDGLSSDREISQLESVLVETLARGVAAGRARIEQQRAATTAQVRFEQFFTAELSQHLTSNPDLLTRRDTEVTLLFCDIRQFSSISERLDAEITMEWLSDVMEAMAECAAEYEGTLVDYIGDELMVMWGAPAPQPDHASRACHAALKMARCVKDLDAKWRVQIGQPTQLGFGINTGEVRVGNVGFERKFRYAPFGNTVNIASRVQGATKYLGATVIVTEATYEQLRERIPSRRLCSVRVLNILEPIVLYELCVDDSATALELCQEYERGLRHYEAEELPQAIHAFSEILRTNISDGPTQLLLSRAVERLIHSGAPFDPVVELPGK